MPSELVVTVQRHLTQLFIHVMAANPIASSSSPILDSGAETKLRGLAEKKQLLVNTIAGMLGPLIHYNGLYGYIKIQVGDCT